MIMSYVLSSADPFTLGWTGHPMGAPEAARSSNASPGSFPASQPSDWAALIRAEQIRAVFKSAPGVWIANLIAGLVIVVAMSKEIPAWTLALWLMTLYATISYVLFLYFRYTREAPAPEQANKWKVRLVIATFLHGCAWGSAGVVMFQPDFTGYQMFLVLGLFMVAISVVAGGLAAFMPMVYALVVPTIAPLLIRTAIEGDLLHWMVTAGGILLLTIVLYFAAQMNGLIVES